MSFYRLDDDRALRDQEQDQPPSRHERSHKGQQMAGCECTDCLETRERLQRGLTQAETELDADAAGKALSDAFELMRERRHH